MRLLSILLLLMLTFSVSLTHALDPVAQTGKGLAIKGYDPVAFFVDQAAYKGKPDFEYNWKGATWRFVSQENLDKFKRDPEAYEPQYGGYCAYAVSLGETARADPRQFTLHQGKLYFNFNNRTKINWEDDRDQHIESANANWPVLIAE